MKIIIPILFQTVDLGKSLRIKTNKKNKFKKEKKRMTRGKDILKKFILYLHNLYYRTIIEC